MNNKELSYKIFLQGRRFEDSAELIFKSAYFDPNKYYIPAWVMAAFGLELYLKSIQQFEKGTIIKTHNIEYILNELSDESKAKIRKSFKEDVLRNPPPNIEDIEKQSGARIANDFDRVLNDISSLFVDFRYIFEQKNEEKSFMYIENLRKVIVERVSELGIDKE